MFSDPVVGKDFFGRQEIIDLLIKRATALKAGYRQNVAIIGHQQLGKTSVLRHFLHVFKDPEVLPIYVEIKFQALDYFVDQFARALLYQYLLGKSKGNPSDTLQQLRDEAAPFIPKTVSCINEIAQMLKQRRPEEAYTRLFELTHVLKLETGMSAIVILDEFHRLGEMGMRNAFSDFGKRIMVQKETMYILSSSSFSQSKKILAEKLSLLFGHFERVYLTSFDFDTAFQFIEEKLRPLTISNDIRHFIVSITDGHPFFLETIVSRLRELSLAKGEASVSPESAGDCFLKLMYESQGVLNQYFSKLLSRWTGPGVKGSHVFILTEIAKGKNKLKDIASAINRRQSETSAQLDELIEFELLTKNGVFYRLNSKTFRFWLKEVYLRKELSLLGMNDKSEAFTARITELLVEENQLLSADITDRLMNLLQGFQNDLVDLGEKKRKLPHFTELIKVRPSHSEKPSRDLIAKGHGRCWVCKITEEKATERQIIDLLQNEPSKSKNSTKVLLALNGLDENAKLLAKNKHVLTLGLSRINLLMDLYSRPPVIHSHPSTQQ